MTLFIKDGCIFLWNKIFDLFFYVKVFTMHCFHHHSLISYRMVSKVHYHSAFKNTYIQNDSRKLLKSDPTPHVGIFQVSIIYPESSM